ncbi:hypothetical protein B194_1165 [Serratia plymuthica A30]|nr:hypothetical protein B194_1165 [Serratia plymuthica A30]
MQLGRKQKDYLVIFHSDYVCITPATNAAGAETGVRPLFDED